MKQTYLYEESDSSNKSKDNPSDFTEESPGKSHKDKSKNKKESGQHALILVAVISFLVLVICVIRLTIYSISSYNDTKNIEKLSEIKENAEPVFTDDEAAGHQSTQTGSDSDINPVKILPKYTELYTENSDLAGWISIDGTNIDYPVMLTPSDMEFYLHRNFEGNDSDEGLPFIDSSCSLTATGSNLLIYGHNMKNGDMFADLLKYQDQSYYQNHKIIRFDTIYEEGSYEIIAVFRSRVAYKDENTFRFYNFTGADNESDYNYYIKNINRLSLYPTVTTAVYPDRLITLVTCEYTEEDGRFVVVAKKTEA